MPLKLMYITNNPEIAKIAENAGVDRVFVDMEYIGKELRQGGMDTVKSHHTIDDIKNIKKVIKNAEIMVRCNPIHDKSSDEIEKIISAGADIIMLPYFKTVDEVKKFISIVNGRVKTFPLVETPQAADLIDEILELDGIDEMFVGLNDLSLGYKKHFMFELLSDGTIDKLANKFKNKNMQFGFGGIASLGKGDLPSEKIIIEHYRVGSTCAILSRSFYNANQMTNIEEIRNVFDVEIKKIREFENSVLEHTEWYEDNRLVVKQKVEEIVHRYNA